MRIALAATMAAIGLILTTPAVAEAATTPETLIADARTAAALDERLLQAAEAQLAGGSAEPAPAPAIGFTYSEPVLVDPLVVEVGGSNGYVKLPKDRDAIVRSTSPVTRKGGLGIAGGRNVVVDAEVKHSTDYAPGAKGGNDNRALQLLGNSVFNGSATTTPREVFVKRLVMSGVVKEGVNIDLRGDKNVTVTINHLDAGGASFPGSYSAHHADVIQAWNGPKLLRLNRVWAPRTGYQGIFLQQSQFGDETGYAVEIRNTFIGGDSDSAYLMWNSHSDRITVGENVAVWSERFGDNRGRVLWGDGWDGVQLKKLTREQVLGGGAPAPQPVVEEAPAELVEHLAVARRDNRLPDVILDLAAQHLGVDEAPAPKPEATPAPEPEPEVTPEPEPTPSPSPGPSPAPGQPVVDDFTAETTSTSVRFTATTDVPTQRTVTLTGPDGRQLVNRNTTDESGARGDGFLGRTTHTAPMDGLTAGTTYTYVARFAAEDGAVAILEGTITT